MVFRHSCCCVCIRNEDLQTENIINRLCELDGGGFRILNIKAIAVFMQSKNYSYTTNTAVKFSQYRTLADP